MVNCPHCNKYLIRDNYNRDSSGRKMFYCTSCHARFKRDDMYNLGDGLYEDKI